MDDEEVSRLSRLTTHWGQIEQIKSDRASLVQAAQNALILRYGKPIKRYLLGSLRDPDAADEVAQEFALRLVKGYFRNADPERGRFRDFVKRVLRNLMLNDRQRKMGRPEELAFDIAEPVDDGPDETVLLNEWRDDLLRRAWERLLAEEKQSGQPFHSVLHYRATNPDKSSTQMAEELTAQLKPEAPFNDAAIRKKLERARRMFADLLLEEAERLLQTTTKQSLEEGLIDMGLYEYCRLALERRDQSPDS
jgi:DNA-directed RNA polymerase specialized sigma24 family protein